MFVVFDCLFSIDFFILSLEIMNTCSSNTDISYADNYISLNDFVVNFTPEVTKFFIERIGEEEFMSICRKSCQAPPYFLL